MGNVVSVERTGVQSASRAVGAPRVGRHRPIRTRRLSDKLIVAFHVACDSNDYEVAWRLLELAERVLKRSTPPDGEERRREIVGLAAAHFRLWGLVHVNRQ